ncbi:MAG: DUF881 domain-containing protein [Actinobacteria bacterium]|uniref:Unannotated protein n=1 Tax=freshwater metagenome TaxID=449393 RepID=A0A6J6R099_9ZZZZ|nr:DUF881 domain-containing protein [Actinomycetota bacterium]
MPETRGPGRGTAARGDTSTLPPRVTMPLLTLITQQSLDEDYLHVAERRPPGELPPSRRRPRRTAAVVVAVFGVLVTTAAIQTSADADLDQAGRTSLIRQITDERASLSRLQDRIERVRDQDTAADAALSQLTDTTVDALSRLRRLQIRTGYLPVQGEGVRIEVADAPPGGESIQDIDLRKLVNGLWQAGAEAIAINGQRLTVLTTIRNSGPVINVNSRPLAAPYVVEAIGDTRTLQADLLATESGVAFASLANQYGWVVTRQNEQSVALPAAPTKLLRHTEILTSDVPRPDLEETTP